MRGVNARLALAGHPHSIAQARRFTVQTLARWALGQLRDDTELLVSELTTNALLHGGGAAELRLAADGRELRVEVHDVSPMLPSARNYGVTSTTGRGLRMVDLLSADWGAEPTENGKRVWFTLPLAGSESAREEVFAFDIDEVEAL